MQLKEETRVPVPLFTSIELSTSMGLLEEKPLTAPPKTDPDAPDQEPNRRDDQPGEVEPDQPHCPRPSPSCPTIDPR